VFSADPEDRCCIGDANQEWFGHRLDTDGVGQDLLDVQDGNQFPVRQFGDRGNQALVAGQHGLGRFDPVPIHPDDAVHIVHEEA
jgi:hypothetical protein